MDNFPSYSPEHYAALTGTLDPIEEYDGFSIKNGERFQLGLLKGSKVRQCLHVVHENLDRIRHNYNGGIVTGAGLPSPQVPIVAGVAKYFGLKCCVTTPRFDNAKRDYNRINASVAQKLGATVYGVGNPNPSGYEKDAKELCKQFGYAQIKFGMIGDVAMEPVTRQVENIPEHIDRIVIVSGSGLSALSILKGLARFKKPVAAVYVVTLSGHFHENYMKWYENQPEKFDGQLEIIPSPYPYRMEHKAQCATGLPGMDFDITYESKAYTWMREHLPRSERTLFWVVGKREYDLALIEPIDWHLSEYETSLRTPSASLFA